MNKKWKYFLPGYIWSLPLTIIGFVLALVYKAHSWEWRDGVLTAIGGTNKKGKTRIWGRPNAQTHGWLMFFDSEQNRENTGLRVHEYCHTVQSFIGGIFFGIAYVLCFFGLWVSLAVQGQTNWYFAYRNIPFEKQAFNVQDKFNAGKIKNAWGT